MMQLDTHQRAAAYAPAQGRLDVLAGAGTGKTRVLVARALRLSSLGYEVKVYAYTRAAAREIERRLDGHEGIAVSTIHADAYSRSRQDARNAPVLVSEQERERMAREASKLSQPLDRYLCGTKITTHQDALEDALSTVQERCAGGKLAVLVDEAQDLTATERRWIDLQQADSLTMVGDLAQAIYGFRGATAWAPRPDARPLPVNYRSARPILDWANRLPIQGRIDLVSDRPEGYGMIPPHIWWAADDEEILRGVARTWKGSAGGGRLAILSRTKERLQLFHTDLLLHGIPVHAPAMNADLWEKNSDARSLLATLRVVDNPHDSLHLRQLLHELAGMTPAELARAEAGRAGLDACSLWDWCAEHLQADSSGAALMRRIHDARRWSDDSLAAARLAWRGPDWIRGLLPADQTVQEFLAWAVSPRDREQAAPLEGAVTLSTIHGAKGQEWPVVVVLGLEEGHLPHERADVDEERRLLYVAMTRAQSRLILTHSASVRTHGKTVSCSPSRFLKELSC